MIKRLLERLHIVRLVWLTESWKHEGYRTELRVVRFQGPDREPWCRETDDDTSRRVRLLSNGSCKSRYRCTWQPYNKRSPQFGDIQTRDQLHIVKPEPSAWAA